MPKAKCRMKEMRRRLPCTAEQLQTLRALIGEDAEAEDCVSRIIEQLQSRDEIPILPPHQRRICRRSLRRRGRRFSAFIAVAAGDATGGAVGDGGVGDREIRRGGQPGISFAGGQGSAGGDACHGGDGKANMIALSRAANPGGDRCLAMAIADAFFWTTSQFRWANERDCRRCRGKFPATNHRRSISFALHDQDRERIGIEFFAFAKSCGHREFTTNHIL
jgi:hypothetical protein